MHGATSTKLRLTATTMSTMRRATDRWRILTPYVRCQAFASTVSDICLFRMARVRKRMTRRKRKKRLRGLRILRRDTNSSEQQTHTWTHHRRRSRLCLPCLGLRARRRLPRGRHERHRTLHNSPTWLAYFLLPLRFLKEKYALYGSGRPLGRICG